MEVHQGRDPPGKVQIDIDASKYFYPLPKKDKKGEKKKKTWVQISVSYWCMALSVLALYYVVTRSGQQSETSSLTERSDLSQMYEFSDQNQESNIVTKVFDHFRKSQMKRKLGLDDSSKKSFRGRASIGNETEEDLQLYTFSQCFSYVTKGEFNPNKMPNDTLLIDTLMEGKAIVNVTPDLMFIFMTLLLGWLLRLVFINYHSPLPFTVALMTLGILLSFMIQMFSCFSGPNVFQSMINFVDIENLNGHRILFVFLPVLLFESAFDIDSHLFFRAIKPILLLAVPGLILSSFMSGALADIFFRSFGQMASQMNAPGIRFPLTLTFGSLISATDPVAVVALLKEIGGSKILGTMIEGEALLNDGAAIVLYTIALSLTGINENGFTSSHGHGSSHGDDASEIISENITGEHRNYVPFDDASFTYDELVYRNIRSDHQNETAVEYIIPSVDSYLKLIAVEVFTKTIMPVLYGLILAKISSKLLYTIFDDMLSEVSFPLIMCYMSYYFSEMMGGSGVLTCVFFGLFLEKNSICTEHHEFLHKFFQMLAYISNTLIFFLVGLVVACEFLGGSSSSIDGAQTTGQKLWVSFWYYIIITFVRFISIAIFSMFTQNQGVFAIGINEVLVMTWGGLRGAVSLCLALNLLAAPTAPDFYKEVANDILICTAMVVFMTLFINAMSVKGLLEKLGMLDITASMHATMTVAIDNLADDTNRSIVTFRFDPFLADARWSEVNKRTYIDYPYDHKPTEEELIRQLTEGTQETQYDSQGNSIVDEDEFNPYNTPKTLKEMNPESVADSTYRIVKENAIKRALKSLKMNIGKQFGEGTISQEVYLVLETAINKGVDSNRFVERDDLKKNWEIGPFLMKCKSTIEGIMFDERVKKEVCPHTKRTGPFRKPLIRLYFWLTRSNTFDNVFQGVVLLNIPFIIAEFMMGDDVEEEVFKTFLLINVGFFVLYFVEFIVKLVGLTAAQYFTNAWCLFDFFILLISAVDVVFLLAGELIDMYCAREENAQTDFCINSGDNEDQGGSMIDNVLKIFKSFKLMKATKAIKVLKILRAARALKFLKTVFPWTLGKVEGIIDVQLSFGYSVGRCFIKAQEELIRNFPSMIDNPNVLQDLNVECEKNRLDVDRDLGILQREKPELAIAIKTKTAIRTILNTQKSQIKKFRAGGILDDHESKLLFDVIERNMKSLTFNFPVCMEPQPESEMIDTIPWLNGNQELINYMKSVAEKLDFDIEDILIQEGEEVDGIYLVTSGMVRVFGRGMNSYDPDTDNKDPNQQDENGNFTHYDSTYSKENKFSYVHSGGLIGEIGVMLQRESDLTAECETACSAYLIRAEHIQTALDKFINLKNCIWKSIGINVALNQSIAAELLEIGSTSEQRRQYLEPSYFKDMWSAEQFIFDDSSNAVILIFGKVRIEYTIPKGTKKKEKYQPKIIKAPALIKHEFDEKYNIIDQTFHAIVSKNTGLTPKLLIVPAEVADDADMGNAIMDRITNFGGKDSVMGRSTGPNRSSKVGAAPIRALPVMIPPQITEARTLKNDRSL